MTDRRLLFARTTLEIISAKGLHALTHRAVDEAAGVPAGSVYYYAPTRSKLMQLALGAARQLMWDIAMVSFAPMTDVSNLDEDVVLDCTTDFVLKMATDGESFVKAYYAILVEAQFDAELFAEIMRQRTMFIEFTQPFVSVFEPNHTERVAELVVALMEGLIQQQALVAAETFPRSVIRGMIARIFGFPGGEVPVRERVD